MSDAAVAPSLMMPVIELVPVLVILKVPASLIAAALNTSVLMVMLPNSFVPPTVPVNVVSPVPFVVTLNVLPVVFPLTVEPNEMLPFDVVVSVLLVLKVTAPE